MPRMRPTKRRRSWRTLSKNRTSAAEVAVRPSALTSQARGSAAGRRNHGEISGVDRHRRDGVAGRFGLRSAAAGGKEDGPGRRVAGSRRGGGDGAHPAGTRSSSGSRRRAAWSRGARAASGRRSRGASSGCTSTRAIASRPARRSSRSTRSPTRWRCGRRRRRSIGRGRSAARSRPTWRGPQSCAAETWWRSRRWSASTNAARRRPRGGARSRRGVALARHNLEQTLVRAPYAGSIGARLADEGTTALVQPQTIVIVLQETAELEAARHDSREPARGGPGGRRGAAPRRGLHRPIETQVTAVGDTIDPATRTYRVRMQVPNPDHGSRPASSRASRSSPRRRADVLLVPREAIRSEDGRTRVLVVRTAAPWRSPVELGDRHRGGGRGAGGASTRVTR